MITANSVRPTHIDTEAPGKLTAEDFEKLHAQTWRMPPPAIRVPRPFWVRWWRSATRPVLRWWYAQQAMHLGQERTAYEEAEKRDGKKWIGPDYRRNTDQQLLDLRSKQAWLDLE